ncbi:uncharacterized protein LOC130696867 [Daphnia carinata]|uniref:uncharacterized protein LOC130696867 n=1 Tax=Daphnia carinata TaxID=120202 RepID=UPI00257A1B84|nr:uncharacterized protein LOC130696867 [Daphnia carinata]
MSSNMDSNMDTMNPFNNLFVMDDPTTPLYVPVCNSFDQEFQLQDNYRINMLPQNTTLKSSGTAEASPITALPYQSPDEQIEFPLDLFDYLENVPFNIQELIEEDNYGKVLCDTGNYQESRRNPNSNILSDELLSTPTTELVQAESITEAKNEDAVMNFEEQCYISPFPTYQLEENIKRESLCLNLPSTLQLANNSSKEDVTTPELINMLLESEETSKKQQISVDVKPTLVYSELPQVLQDISSDSATEYSLPPTPVPRTRTNTKRSSNPSKNSDLRRVRNNEASRKSRQNRRKKLQTQAQLVDVLEEENRRLTNQIREFETLKAEMMKYMTGRINTTTPLNNGTSS